MKRRLNGDPFERRENDYLSGVTRLEKNQLHVMHIGGFFAICTTTLSALARIYPTERYVKVNWPRQNLWRDKSQGRKNLFDLYFHPNSSIDTHTLAKMSPINGHGVYKDLRFRKLNPYVQNYFAPSDIVIRKQEELVRKYKIDYENTVGLWYRGTNKWIEVPPIPPDYYIRVARRLLAKNHNLRLLVQTDQEQVRDMFLREFRERAFYISEMPVTKSLTSFESDHGKVSNFDFGTTLLAVVNIIAKCRYVITHTGNVGLWLCLYRGTAENTCQLRPREPDVIWHYPGDVGSASNTAKVLWGATDLEDEVYALRSDLESIRASATYRLMKFLRFKIER